MEEEEEDEGVDGWLKEWGRGKREGCGVGGGEEEVIVGEGRSTCVLVLGWRLNEIAFSCAVYLHH